MGSAKNNRKWECHIKKADQIKQTQSHVSARAVKK